MRPPTPGSTTRAAPLTSLGLGTAFPYKVKASAPDSFYTFGQSAGVSWGAVLTVRLRPQKITRQAIAGKTSGWRLRRYTTLCDLEVLSYEPHLETAELGLDNLVDGLLDLIYADRTLGTTSNTYPTGRLITQAGEMPAGIDVGEAEFVTDGQTRGKARGGIEVQFDCDTFVMA